MWRVGVLAILSVVFASEAAEYQYGTQLRRLKRSPHYDCPPYYPPRPPRFWPPPPHHHHFGPPPFWPPPPPPQEEQNQANSQSQAESSAKSGALIQQPSGQDRDSRQDRGQGEFRGQGQGQNREQEQAGGNQYPGNPPCDSCGGKGHNSAISNAKSDTGSAIAIAISGKNRSK